MKKNTKQDIKRPRSIKNLKTDILVKRVKMDENHRRQIEAVEGKSVESDLKVARRGKVFDFNQASDICVPLNDVLKVFEKNYDHSSKSVRNFTGDTAQLFMEAITPMQKLFDSAYQDLDEFVVYSLVEDLEIEEEEFEQAPSYVEKIGD